jgi:hypothetical protein
MHEVWEAFDPEAVPRFYHRDVVGHHRGQTLSFADILNRLAWNQHRNAAPISDIMDIVAAENRFAIRFEYTAKEAEAGNDFHAEVIYFYPSGIKRSSSFGYSPTTISTIRLCPDWTRDHALGQPYRKPN